MLFARFEVTNTNLSTCLVTYPAILEDTTLKGNHHLHQRVLDEHSSGEVLHLCTDASAATIFKYWKKCFRF